MRKRVAIVGGGAAGFFAAIACAEANPEIEVVVLEKSPRFLDKVRISGGGRCNVTHAPDDGDFASNYPRGEHALRGPLRAFGAADAIEWFARRGVEMYIQDDGCLFPVTDSSHTVIDCFMAAARKAGVQLRVNAAPERILRRPGGGFEIMLPRGETFACDRVLLATGGCRTSAMGALAVSLGHTLEPPVPSLFTFHVGADWVHELAGIVVQDVEAACAGLRERGILLFTHWGVSGPVILRLSAWGARKLAEAGYKFALRVNWLPSATAAEIADELKRRRQSQPAKLIVNAALAPLQARLWEALVVAAGIGRDTRWSELSRAALHRLTQQLIHSELWVTGKTMNKDEFVTCGGVRLSEINFKTMESRICPGLYVAGELLDVDGITGGFNFQGCWTTGWLAGKAMAQFT